MVPTAAGQSLAALTGHPGGPDLAPPERLLEAMSSLAGAISHATAQVGRPVVLDAEDELTARAGQPGIYRRGNISANGSCRLLRCRDGWAALNLPRPDDLASLPALTGRHDADPSITLAAWGAETEVAEAVRWARLLALPAARLCTPAVVPQGVAPVQAVTVERRWPSTRIGPIDQLRVIDLSVMWAGPLASSVLARAGATVVKVGSVSRPDGARAVPELYGRLHAPGQAEVTIDLGTSSGREELHRLIEGADVVVTSARRRAVEQLGCTPERLGVRPGRVWLAISGYGWHEPGRDWVAFGDDAAVAGGLVTFDGNGNPVFLGDAAADPVTGMCAAAAVLASLRAGGGHLLSVSMAGCAAALAAGEIPWAC